MPRALSRPALAMPRVLGRDSRARSAYLGPLSSDGRQQAIEQCRELCVSAGLPMVSTGGFFSLSGLLADPITLRQWSTQGLPTDDVSVDNGAIVSVSGRWPFLIDPQSIAKKWVIAMETKGDDKQLLIWDLRVKICISTVAPSCTQIFVGKSEMTYTHILSISKGSYFVRGPILN